MTITTRPGYFLEDNPPDRIQSGTRRNGHKPTLILTHTAESGTNLRGPDLSAEGTANWIRKRSTAGSYHQVGDRDSIIPMIRTRHAAWGSKYVNDWAVHISLGMNADDWPTLTTDERDAYVDTWVQMAVAEARNIEAITGQLVPPILLTGEEARQGGLGSWLGHCTHGRVDPDRRDDPGDGFPWKQALTLYATALDWPLDVVEIRPDPKDTHGGPTVPTTPASNPLIAELQEALAAAGYKPGPADGIYGPRTHASAKAAAQDVEHSPKIAAADSMAAAYHQLMEATS